VGFLASGEITAPDSITTICFKMSWPSQKLQKAD